jgi:hypothetical protein
MLKHFIPFCTCSQACSFHAKSATPVKILAGSFLLPILAGTGTIPWVALLQRATKMRMNFVWDKASSKKPREINEGYIS